MSQQLMTTGHGSLRRTPEPSHSSIQGRNLGRVNAPPLFGQMFPSLADEPHSASDAALKALGEAMLESDVDPSGDTANIPAGFTYLGQFVDHDITLDTTPLSKVINDPLAIENFRTPALDLDSLYARGPGDTNYLFDRNDPEKFLIGVTQPVGSLRAMPNDLPRNPQGLAIIGDHRNDENLLVAQTHLAFLKFHNAVIDHLRSKAPTLTGDALFVEARRIVTWHYQWIVLFDFIERLTEPGLVRRIKNEGRKIYRFKKRPYMPIEFATAVYRLGHSMVRERYSHNAHFADTGFDLLFLFSGLSGRIGNDFETLPSNWIIDWRRFYAINETNPASVPLNMARKIDPLLARELHQLPDGSSLPERNLLRGRLRSLPSGQAVARFVRGKVGTPVMTPAQIATGPDGAVARQHGMDADSPLWYYILKEAQVLGNGGERLGPLGSRIVAEVFLGLVAGDVNSFIRDENAFGGKWSPDKEDHPLPSKTPGAFTMADMLRFVDDISPVG
ncbi:MAG: heme peroxidase family protein [Pseudomonadota bacterium]